MSKTIAIYTRVSSRSQDTQSQEPDLKRWAESQGKDQPVRWYRDKFTGKTMDQTRRFDQLGRRRLRPARSTAWWSGGSTGWAAPPGG